MGLILVGLTVRLATSFIVLCGNHFSVTEMGFVALSWIPKATVQVCVCRCVCACVCVCVGRA